MEKKLPLQLKPSTGSLIKKIIEDELIFNVDATSPLQ